MGDLVPVQIDSNSQRGDGLPDFIGRFATPSAVKSFVPPALESAQATGELG
jgi:hypothetical protein